MATVNFFPEADGLFGYAFPGDRYTLEGATPSEAVLTLNDGEDPTRYPSSIVLGLENVEFYTATTGPDAGTPVISGGEITSVTYRDENDATAIEITDISLDAVLVSEWIAADELFGFYQYAVQGGSTFNGSDGFEDIKSGVGDDTVFANDGGANISDRGGSDNYVGGNDFDTIKYDEWFFNPIGLTQGIEVTYTSDGNGSVIGPDGETDTFSSIEKVVGTMLDDSFTGSDGAQTFIGLAGEDTFNGGAGSDIVEYHNDARFGGTAGVEVDLSGPTGIAIDGFGNSDTLISIERIRGTEEADLMIDNANADNDFIGNGGDDTFIFSGGNNFVFGGGGADEYVIADGATGSLFIDDFDPAEDVLRIEGATSLAGFTVSQNQDGVTATIFGEFEVFAEGITLAELSFSNLELGPA